MPGCGQGPWAAWEKVSRPLLFLSSSRIGRDSLARSLTHAFTHSVIHCFVQRLLLFQNLRRAQPRHLLDQHQDDRGLREALHRRLGRRFDKKDYRAADTAQGHSKAHSADRGSTRSAVEGGGITEHPTSGESFDGPDDQSQYIYISFLRLCSRSPAAFGPALPAASRPMLCCYSQTRCCFTRRTSDAPFASGD